MKSTRATLGLLPVLGLVVWLLAGCANATPIAAKKPTSESATDADALFSDESIVDSAPDSEVRAVDRSTAAPTSPPKAKPSWSVPGTPVTGPSRSPRAPEADPQVQGTPSAPGKVDDRRWSVLLMSFTGEDHAQLARAACEQIRGRFKDLTGAFVRSKTNGSVVLVGRFASPKDPEAKPMLKAAQSIVDGNTRPFARALLTRWEPSRDTKPGPHDLRQARRANPGAARLFSLEVAVWSDFGSEQIAVDEIRKKAEAYARELRMQGSEAFYFHDDDRRMSIVTVGVFGEDAYNPQTMLFSDAVDQSRRKFPKLLVNGEELLKLKQPGSKDTVPEPSVLVEVPE